MIVPIVASVMLAVVAGIIFLEGARLLAGAFRDREDRVMALVVNLLLWAVPCIFIWA
jgi:uncharacterized membrane protein HdeD (DUF308 family)